MKKEDLIKEVKNWYKNGECLRVRGEYSLNYIGWKNNYLVYKVIM